MSQRATYAYLKGMDDGLERHTCGYGQSKRGEKQRNEGIQLENGNENNKADDGDESREKQKDTVMIDHGRTVVDDPIKKDMFAYSGLSIRQTGLYTLRNRFRPYNRRPCLKQRTPWLEGVRRNIF